MDTNGKAMDEEEETSIEEIIEGAKPMIIDWMVNIAQALATKLDKAQIIALMREAVDELEKFEE